MLEKIERREVSKLRPYAKNARLHSPDQINALVASIEEFGFTFPVLIDEKGTILAGHGRVLAAEKRGMSHVPVLVARNWPADRKRAYVLADNRLAEQATWDKKLLGTELGNLQLAGFNIDAIGFSHADVKALVANAANVPVDPEDAPATPATPVSKIGDLWIFEGGGMVHRVLCGDCTKADQVAKLFDGAKPHLMVTDPPYGVSYDANWRNEAVRTNGEKIGGRAVGKVANDERCDWREAWILFPGAVAYVWHAGRYCADVAQSLKASKFDIRSQIVWVKSNFAIGRGDYHWGHEPAYYAVKEGAKNDRWVEEHETAAYAVRLGETAQWAGGRKQSTVWQIDMVRNDTGHSTQKPLECMRRPIINNSKGGDLVYDPFLGSGTTLIAAHMEGRVCLGLELDPAYCDVIIRRWQAVSGCEARLVISGMTFAQVETDRHGKAEKARPNGSRKGGGGAS